MTSADGLIVNQNITADCAVTDRLDQIWKDLTAPGADFEVMKEIVRGELLNVYVNAPIDVREIWRDTAALGERDYLVYGNERITYAAAHKQVAALSRWLWDMDIRPGDRVAIAMRNYPEWMLIYWACVTLGIGVVGMNAWWTAEEMTLGLVDTSPKAIFCDQERLDRLLQCNLAQRPHVVAVRAQPKDGALDWASVFRSAAAPPPEVMIDPDQDLCIFFTSGTTGRSKGAQLSHRGCVNAMMNIRFNTAVVRQISGEESDSQPDDPASEYPIGLVPTPLFHVTANPSLMLPVTFAGGTLVLMHKWDPDEALALIETEGVTVVYGVPTQVRELVGVAEAKTRDISSLAVLSGGGATMQADLVSKVADLDYPVLPSTGFGMTETCGAVTALTGKLFVERPESVGRPFPTTEIKIVDDCGTASAIGAPGELWVRGASVIKGYFGAPEATAEAIVDGWLRTGDIARIDDDGFLYIVDRKKDMIIRGGENVYCAEVEAALYRHPGIAEACVFSVPDARLGEEVGAALSLTPNAAETNADMIRRTLSSIIALHKIPRYIWILDDPLPRNANGKFLRRNLQADLILTDAR